jgi:hypothetical protein
MTETIGDKIVQALDVIRTKGWCAGSRSNIDGEVCALGALDAVLYRDSAWRLDTWWYTQARLALAMQVDPEDLTEDDEYNGVSVEQLREARRSLDEIPDRPLWGWRAETVVAGYNNTHTREEVEAWFEKAAMNVGVTGGTIGKRPTV